MLRALICSLAVTLSFSLFGQQPTLAYSQMDDPPTYKGCSSDLKAESMACTQQAIEAFAKQKFDTGLFKHLNLNERRIRVYSQFTIDQTGNIKDIKVRTAHPQLENEAKRVLQLLPNFIPGSHEGLPAATTYSLPLVFTLG